MRRSATILAAGILFAGCLQPTEIVVSILSRQPDSSTTKLTITFATVKNGGTTAPQTIEVDSPRFPVTLGLFGTGSRRIEITASATGKPCSRSAEVSFVEGKVMLLRLPIECATCSDCVTLDDKALVDYDDKLVRPALEAGTSACLDCGTMKDGDFKSERPPDLPATDAKVEQRRDAPGKDQKLDGKRDGKLDLPKALDGQKDGPKPDAKKDGPAPDTKQPDGPKPDAKKDGPAPDTKKVDAPKPDLPKPDTKKADLPKPDLPKPDMNIPTLPSCANGYCFIPAGTFQMGSPATDPCRDLTNEFYHQVSITRHFEMGQTELTVAQLNALKAYDADLYDVSSNKTCGNNCPVEQVTWNQAAHLCNLVSIQRGYSTCYQCSGTWPLVFPCSFKYTDNYSCPGYRLPTEAEWEYAARAGTTTVTYAGNPVTGTCTETPAATAMVSGIAWYPSNSAGTKHPVGQKGSNPWGLQDMFGNVLEWTGDDYVLDLTVYATTDPWIYNTFSTMSIRGPSYRSPFQWSDVRAGNRLGRTNPDVDLGFRCVRSLTGTLP